MIAKLNRRLQIRLLIAIVTLPILGWIVVTHNQRNAHIPDPPVSYQSDPYLQLLSDTNVNARIEVNGMLLTAIGTWDYRNWQRNTLDIPPYFLKAGTNILSVTWSATDATKPMSFALSLDCHDASLKDGIRNLCQINDHLGNPATIMHNVSLFKIAADVPRWNWVSGDRIVDTAQMRTSLYDAYVALRNQAHDACARYALLREAKHSTPGSDPGAAHDFRKQLEDQLADPLLLAGLKPKSQFADDVLLETLKNHSRDGGLDAIPEAPLFEIMASGTLARLHGYGDRPLLVFRNDWQKGDASVILGPEETLFDPWFRRDGGKWVLAALWCADADVSQVATATH